MTQEKTDKLIEAIDNDLSSIQALMMERKVLLHLKHSLHGNAQLIVKSLFNKDIGIVGNAEFEIAYGHLESLADTLMEQAQHTIINEIKQIEQEILKKYEKL